MVSAVASRARGAMEGVGAEGPTEWARLALRTCRLGARALWAPQLDRTGRTQRRALRSRARPGSADAPAMQSGAKCAVGSAPMTAISALHQTEPQVIGPGVRRALAAATGHVTGAVLVGAEEGAALLNPLRDAWFRGIEAVGRPRRIAGDSAPEAGVVIGPVPVRD